MSKGPDPGNITAEDVEAQRKVLEVAPTKQDFARQFGERGLVENADGTWQYNLPQKDGAVPVRTLKAASEMNQHRHRAESRAAESMDQRVPKVTIRDERGNKISVPEHHAERIDRVMFERRRRR